MARLVAPLVLIHVAMLFLVHISPLMSLSVLFDSWSITFTLFQFIAWFSLLRWPVRTSCQTRPHFDIDTKTETEYLRPRLRPRLNPWDNYRDRIFETETKVSLVWQLPSIYPTLLHCVKRKFGYLQNKGTFLRNFVPNSGLLENFSTIGRSSSVLST